MSRFEFTAVTPVVIAALLGTVATTSALAQIAEPKLVATRAASPSEELLNDRLVIDLGVFVVRSNTNGSLRGTANTTDQSINFDQAFGLDANKTRWRADVMWRITSRQRLRFGYFDDDVSKTKTFDDNLEWGDYTFLANGAVTAEVKRRVYQLDYEFALIRRRNFDVSATAGVHFDDLTLTMSGNATVTLPDGTLTPQNGVTKQSTLPQPLPVVGLRGDWAITDRWYIDGSMQAFKANYQTVDGYWTDLRVGISYVLSNHIGVGAGFERWATHVDVSNASFNGRLNFGYQGGLIYVRTGF